MVQGGSFKLTLLPLVAGLKPLLLLLSHSRTSSKEEKTKKKKRRSWEQRMKKKSLFIIKIKYDFFGIEIE